MKRDIIKIDEELCNGCGICVPNCHEGALQIIDEKARLISDLMCDGLGACIGHCPEGAITIEQREAVPYDEIAVITDMVSKGRNTIIAHLQHLKEHNEVDFFKQGVQYLEQNRANLPFDLDDVKHHVHNMIKPNKNNLSDNRRIETKTVKMEKGSACGGACPGSATIDFKIDIDKVQGQNSSNQSAAVVANAISELKQWPVQLHLVSPQASYFKNADVVLAADCVAFSMGNFHSEFLKGRSLAIACPKLDSNVEVYIEKLTSMIENSKINTLTVVMMEVPCCGGLLQMAKIALKNSSRKIPIKQVVIGIQGNILSEDWV
ncbi:MAG: 4Fe-4S binding protein [Saprospiraceae bacterium]|nr:4Fe-4S binding protein [Saprospiraceae bacterium]